MKTLLKSAIAAAALASIGSAQAVTLTFDGLAASPFALSMPLLGDGDEFYQGGFFMDPFSNQGTAQVGDLVGAIVDGSDLANTCFSVACPTNNATKFYTSLNDGVLYLSNISGAGFSLQSFDASFIGAGGEVFPSTTMILRFQGNKVGGGTLTGSFNLAGQTGGAFSFSHFVTSGAFAAQKFSSFYIFGLACDASGSCSAFTSDKGQFALDNVALAVPEPSEWMLMGLGLAAVASIARRRRAA